MVITTNAQICSITFLISGFSAPSRTEKVPSQQKQSLFHLQLSLRSRQKGTNGVGRSNHMSACLRWVGGWWDSLPVGELIQRICSASWDGERTLIGAELLHWDPGTGRTLSVLPTTECISISTQISPSITNSASFSDWSWQMFPTDPVNVSHKGTDSPSPLL